MALLAQRHRDWGCFLVLPPQTSNVSWGWRGSLPGSFRSPAPNTRTSADSWQPEGAILESCCAASSAHGTARTEAQRLGLLASLAISNFKCNLGLKGVPAMLLSQPCSYTRTSSDSWQPEGAILESCCSASSAHGTTRTEAQK